MINIRDHDFITTRLLELTDWLKDALNKYYTSEAILQGSPQFILETQTPHTTQPSHGMLKTNTIRLYASAKIKRLAGEITQQPLAPISNSLAITYPVLRATTDQLV